MITISYEKFPMRVLLDEIVFLIKDVKDIAALIHA